MQTRIGLRTVGKSANDVKHGVPQAVSPFHPPVKHDDDPPLKQAVVEEKTPNRQSARLRTRKTDQRTLHDYAQSEKSRSTAKVNGKKRATTPGSTKEHKAKKQRVLDFAVKPAETAKEQLVQVEEPSAQADEPIAEHKAKKQRVQRTVAEERAVEHSDETQETKPIPHVHASVDEPKAEKQPACAEEERAAPQSPEPVAEVGPKSETEVEQEPDVKTSTPEVESARSQEHIAPWKRALYIESDEARLQDEKDTLTKLRNDLDITIMFQTANNRIPMFHKIQPMLRGTTKKNITMSHVAKILYLAPALYRIQPKELAVAGKMIETYSVELGAQWKAPLSGKQLEERKNILADKMESYFAENKGKLVIPEIELPKIEKIVDKDKWLKTANMPSGMRDLLRLEERRKEEADKANATLPPITGTGSVKDRRKALMDRIRAKSKK
ncbi:hypothetical protein BJV82DRAFT_595623 [Fennellomyces sp. T-0311]|nr:hypothetical protein BJV82DRAFT_595623 [Fennellomyces sp. T-0311]